MRGWVKLHRRLLSWEWAGDPNMVALFVHLLLKASNRESSWRGIDIRRGQVVTGLHSLSEQTGISIQRLRTCLARLERSGEITKNSTNRFSLITICKFDEYQEKQEEQQQASNKLATNNQQHREKVKKVNKTTSPENDPRFMSFWGRYPRKEGRKQAFKAWLKGGCGNGMFEDVMAGLERQISGPWQERERKFIPHPATWLNGERWKDEVSGSLRSCSECQYKVHSYCDGGKSECSNFTPLN